MVPVYEGFFIRETLPHKLAKDIEYKHITTAFRPNHVHEDLYGTEAKFMIIGYGNDGKNEGYLVKLVSCESQVLIDLFNNISIPHITLSTSIEGKPVDTANIQFTPYDGGVVTAIFGGFLGKPVLKFDTYRPNNAANTRDTLSGKEQTRSAELAEQYEKRVQVAYDVFNGAALNLGLAEEFLANAEKALVDFNRTSNPDDKNMCLATGVYEAYNACRYFAQAITNLNRNDIYNEIDPDGAYRNLDSEIRAQGVSILSVLLKYTAGNNYDKIKHAKDYSDEERRDYKTIPIYEVGLKIYHLKALIDYCKKFRQALSKLPMATANTNPEMIDNINEFVEKADNKFTSLNIFYNETCNNSSNTVGIDTMIQMCTRIRNMFDDYLSAMILYEYTDDANKFRSTLDNIESMDIEDKLDLMSGMANNAAYTKITDFAEHLKVMCEVANTKNIAPLPKDSAEFLGMVDTAKDVALAIKKFLGSITTTQFKKAESYKKEVK